MKATLKLVAESELALQILAQHRLPGKIAHQVARIARQAKDPIEAYKTGCQALVEEHGEPIDPEKRGKGERYRFASPANREAYDLAVDELGAEELELYGEPFALSALRDKQTKELPDIEPGVWIALFDWLIVDDVDVAAPEAQPEAAK